MKLNKSLFVSKLVKDHPMPPDGAAIKPVSVISFCPVVQNHGKLDS